MARKAILKKLFSCDGQRQLYCVTDSSKQDTASIIAAKSEVAVCLTSLNTESDSVVIKGDGTSVGDTGITKSSASPGYTVDRSPSIPSLSGSRAS